MFSPQSEVGGVVDEPSPSRGVAAPVSARWKSRVRMVYVLLVVFAFIALAPLGSIAWKLIDTSREALTTSQREYQHLLASTIARDLDLHVDSVCAQLDRGSRSLALAVVRSEGGADLRVRRALDSLVDDRIRYVRFTDLSQRVTPAPGPEACPRNLEPAFLTAFQVAAESLEGHQGGDPPAAMHSDPLLIPEANPKAFMLVTAPVVSGGTFLGVVSAAVDLQAVWQDVVDPINTPHALFAVDKTGHLIASKNLRDVGIGRDMADSEIVKRFKYHTGLASETIPFAWSAGPAAPAEPYLGSYEVSHQNWGVFVQATERQFYGIVAEMIKSTVSWGMLAFVCALGFAAVLARVLASPIKRLATATRAYGRKDFSARVHGGFISEVGELADRFNNMAAEIEKHIEELKQAAEDYKALFRGTAHALTGAIDAKDPYTRGHSERVNKYSITIAEYYGLSREEINDIDLSSLLHDVGKIGVDDAILKKPGQLTPKEFDAMKKHPEIGEKIMKPVPKAKPLLPGLRWHHERWEGGGYPDGLERENIPLMARIIAVADSFDAMTTKRPYQDPMTPEQARNRLNEMTSAFDPRVIEAFNRAFKAGELRPPQASADAAPVPEPSAV